MCLRNLKISHKLYLGVGIFAILILAILVIAYFDFQQVSKVVKTNLNTYQVLQESDGILNSLISMETGSRGFTITGDDKFLEPFNKGKDDFEVHFNALQRLISKEEIQINRLVKLRIEYEKWILFESNVLEQKRREMSNSASSSSSTSNVFSTSDPSNTYNPQPSPDDNQTSNGLNSARSDDQQGPTDLISSGKGKNSMDSLQTILEDINKGEKQNLESKSRNLTEEQNNTYISLLIGATVVVIFAVFISLLFAFSIAKPIKMLINTTENITRQNYQKPIDLKADSELSVLIRNFNTMQVAIQVREEELSRKNKEIKQQMIEINEASKLKSQFLANMSHELRTPLNSIIGFTTRVIKKSGEVLPQIQLDNLKIVKSEANHLLDLINDLLDYSKLEAGKVELHPELFDLSGVIGEVSDMAKALMEGGPLKYEQELYADKNIMIQSDRIKIKQIVINLMSNAIKYSEQGTIKLSVHKINDMYCIKVKDDGIGIAPENLENIFDEFRQVDGSYTRKAGGTGLGLSITKKYVEMLGGRIEVTSTHGVGSCFTVCLPVDISGKFCSTVADANNIRSILTRKTVVCVDDDPNAQRLYYQCLNENGFNVVALNGQEDVVSKIQEIRPDVVLLDIMLPNKDGWQILTELKKHVGTCKIPVIMASVLSEKKLAFRMKADEYLIKPVSTEELIDCILRTISKTNGIDIIIADDDDNYLDLMKQMLSEESISPRLAMDGTETINLMEEKKADLIILDIMMPNKDGFDVIDTIRKTEKWKDTQIIVVTEKDLSNKERELLNARTEMVVQKTAEQIDFVMQKLIKRIREKAYANKNIDH